MPSSNEYMRNYMSNRRHKRRSLLIEMAGDCCLKCGSITNLEFDHIEPSTMSFRLEKSKLDQSWDKILVEFKKCQLLCRACHLVKSKTEGAFAHGNSGKKGSENSGAKLTDSEVFEIRRLRTLGLTQQVIADKMGVSRENVGAILNGRSWTHI